MWDPYAEFETAVLPNGLTVYVAYWPGKPWVATTTLIHSGARMDLPGLEGTAHFVEHVCSRNACIPYQDIKTFFEGVGGSVELGATSHNFTYYKFFSPIDDIERSLQIFGSMLVTAKIDNFIDAQCAVVHQEYKKANKLPIDIEIKWRRRRGLYGADWPARSLSPLGNPESIDKIIKADLQTYYDSHYTPANMSFVCVGGMNLKHVMAELLVSPFGEKKQGVRSEAVAATADYPAPSENRIFFEFSKHVQTGEPLLAGEYSSSAVVPGSLLRNAVSVTLDMLYRVLFEEVREKRGWAYSVGSNYTNYQAFKEAHVSVNSFALSAIPEIEQVVEDCISRVAEKEDLMREMVNRKLSSFRMLDLKAQSVRNNAVSDLIDSNRIITLQDESERYSSITMDEVREVLNWIRVERRNTLITVP